MTEAVSEISDLCHWGPLRPDPDLRKMGISFKSPVYQVVPSIAERTNDPGKIVTDCENLSGVMQIGDAKCGLSLPASPHVSSSIRRDEFEAQARESFGRAPQLPELTELPPHLLIWWWSSSAVGKPKDLIQIFQDDPKKQDDYCKVIAQQTQKGVAFLDSLCDSPMLYGFYGHATEKEREEWGGGRGVPSHLLGHAHIGQIEHPVHGAKKPDTPNLRPVVDIRELHKYIDPMRAAFITWMRREADNVFEGELFQAIAATTGLESPLDFSLTNSRILYKTAEGPLVHYAVADGYFLGFGEPLPLKQILQFLINVAGHTEEVYKILQNYHADYYKGLIPQKEPLYTKLKQLVYRTNSERDKFYLQRSVDALTSFALMIPPTYGQLLMWQQQGSSSPLITERLARYERLREKMGKDFKPRNIRELMAYDTCRLPGESDRTTNLAVHCSATWFIESHYRSFSEDGQLLVKGLSLFPSLTSEKSVELLGGTILRRE